MLFRVRCHLHKFHVGTPCHFLAVTLTLFTPLPLCLCCLLFILQHSQSVLTFILLHRKEDRV